jgi:hypothetical protein
MTTVALARYNGVCKSDQAAAATVKLTTTSTINHLCRLQATRYSWRGRSTSSLAMVRTVTISPLLFEGSLRPFIIAPFIIAPFVIAYSGKNKADEHYTMMSGTHPAIADVVESSRTLRTTALEGSLE